jgi:hypothetical protein
MLLEQTPREEVAKQGFVVVLLTDRAQGQNMSPNGTELDDMKPVKCSKSLE